MIVFMAPDLPGTSGGLKVIHQMAETLVEAGFDAAVWHGGDVTYPGLGTRAPIVRGLTRELQPGDVWVVPETGGPKWSFLVGEAPVVMLCQGIDFVFQNTDVGEELPGDYPGWPTARSVITVSQAITDFVRAASTPGFPVHPVPLHIDADVFVPSEKQRLISYMPRRRTMDLVPALALVKRNPAMADWTIEAIDNMSQAQVAEVLGRSAIFVYGGEREGFGLPGAEAMAAGAHVIGFHGHGAREYFLPEVAEAIAESDVVLLAEKVAESAALFSDDSAAWAARSAAGRELITSRYNADTFRAGMVTAVEQILASDAVITRPTVAHHYQSHAPSSRVHHRAWVAMRRTGRRALDALEQRRADQHRH